MDTSTSKHAHARPEPDAFSFRWLWLRAYTSNPFYVLSADLVFVGLRMSLDTSGKSFQTGALMLSLLGYTLLLATTACVLLRLGDVWDDVRTILLLVVAMFLAVSVTFDEALALNPKRGVALYLAGWAFAVAVSEGVIRGIRLRLPSLYRVPYYLLLSLFFLYPVALTPLLADPEGRALPWALFGFSTAGGLAFLTLIPAARRGAAYVAGNGSPWRYPLYPWVLFGLFGLAVCGRAYYLCISLHYVNRSESVFGLYFLVPFLFAAVLVLREAGVASGNRVTQGLALSALPVLVVLSAAGHRHDYTYEIFLDSFTRALGGTPLFLTLVGATLVYAHAAARRQPTALQGLTFSLLALAVVGRKTLDMNSLDGPHAAPLLAVGGLQLWLAFARRSSKRFAIAASCLTGGLWVALVRLGLHGHASWLALALIILTLMAIGEWFDDDFARLLQTAGAWVLGLATLVAYWSDPLGLSSVVPEAGRLYALFLTVVAAGFGHLFRRREYQAAALAGLTFWATAVGWPAYRELRRMLVGLDWIAGGLAFFAVAAVISLNKAGVRFRRAAKPYVGVD